MVHALASLTVLDSRAMIADAWATALMVLGPDEGYNLAKVRGMTALFLVRSAEEEIVERATSAFSALTADPPANERLRTPSREVRVPQQSTTLDNRVNGKVRPL